MIMMPIYYVGYSDGGDSFKMSVNNISKLSPTQTVSNIRHQHRCSLIYVKCCNILSKYYKATKVQNTSQNQGKKNK